MNALITGASSGIGRSLAREFAKNRIDLILVSRDKKALDELATELTKSYGISARTIAQDLSVRNAGEEIYQKVKQENLTVDYLVNDAGVGNFGFFIDTDWKKEESMIALNIIALSQLCKLFIPEMVARKRGRVLNIASTAAFQPGPMMAVYFATKAFVLSLSEAIGSELHGTGVTVTALCPGATKTQFDRSANAESSRLFQKKLPSSDEVARYGYSAMMKGKRVAIHGFLNKLLVFAIRLSPRIVVPSVVQWMVRDTKKS